jgi:hypothetical protein
MAMLVHWNHTKNASYILRSRLSNGRSLLGGCRLGGSWNCLRTGIYFVRQGRQLVYTSRGGGQGRKCGCTDQCRKDRHRLSCRWIGSWARRVSPNAATKGDGSSFPADSTFEILLLTIEGSAIGSERVLLQKHCIESASEWRCSCIGSRKVLGIPPAYVVGIVPASAR